MRALALLVVALFALPALAEPSGLIRGEVAQVVEVVDGDTVVLGNGVEVRLVGLQAPKLALGRSGFVEWPLADRSRDTLADLVLDRRIALAFGGRRVDRHGRTLAHLFRDDGLWVQNEMLRLGMARVYSFADNRTAVLDLLATEREARTAGRGIWEHPFFTVRAAADADRLYDSFQLVEGVVVDAAKVRGRVYLNFGTNWRDDFTVSIAPADVRSFGEAQLDPLRLAGRRIRVRGWIYRRNGPMIDATHPEQIELVEDQE